MAWRFSKRSLNNLVGVKPELVEVTKTALEFSSIDFAVTCGVRTVAEQRQLVARGASQTMKSKHITRWGAAWNIPDIREWDGTMQDAMDFYIDTRRSQGRRPFIDGPHFELN